jgi:hypothetical protein
MLVLNGRDRITARRALGHPWFSKVKMNMQRARIWEQRAEMEEESKTPDFTPRIARRDILSRASSGTYVSSIEKNSPRKSVPLKPEIYAEHNDKSGMEAESETKKKWEMKRSESESTLHKDGKIIFGRMSVSAIKKPNSTFQESKFSTDYNKRKISNNTFKVILLLNWV